mmetsp:Transcript_22017/g.61585  ORF Transcript_22017/g.61585 Transcript_22017/m.61585 type:complete len:331 (-) Transcript_22017:280-1272(-)
MCVRDLQGHVDHLAGVASEQPPLLVAVLVRTTSWRALFPSVSHRVDRLFLIVVAKQVEALHSRQAHPQLRRPHARSLQRGALEQGLGHPRGPRGADRVAVPEQARPRRRRFGSCSLPSHAWALAPLQRDAVDGAGRHLVVPRIEKPIHPVSRGIWTNDSSPHGAVRRHREDSFVRILIHPQLEPLASSLSERNQEGVGTVVVPSSHLTRLAEAVPRSHDEDGFLGSLIVVFVLGMDQVLSGVQAAVSVVRGELVADGVHAVGAPLVLDRGLQWYGLAIQVMHGSAIDRTSHGDVVELLQVQRPGLVWAKRRHGEDVGACVGAAEAEGGHT